MEICDLDGLRNPELKLSEHSEDTTKGSEAI